MSDKRREIAEQWGPDRLPGPDVTREAFLAWRAPRDGSTHPEALGNPVWAWLARTGIDAWSANAYFEGPSSIDVGPAWCCDRFGQSSTSLPDGREVLVGGEHEDSYDPDFYIYRDVIVRHPDGPIDIFGYPLDVFPPTDFHSATLLGAQILLVGTLGYPEMRRSGETQVLLLDTRTWRVTPRPTTGDGPGWIGKHEAALAADGRTLTVRGGEVWSREEEAEYLENLDDWQLDLETWTWRRLTKRSWQRWEFRRADQSPNDLFQLRTLLFEVEHGLDLARLVPEGLEDLGLPEPRLPDDPELLTRLYQPSLPHDVLPEREDEHNVYRVRMGDVIVRWVEDFHSIMMTVEGALPQATVDAIVAEVQATLARLEACPYEVVRH